MAVSTRTRFEVFKRDKFTCRYCGGKSPDVVLEIDHITPLCEGGSDETINLATSCWTCNRGKAGVPLDQVYEGEDAYLKAIEVMEVERRIQEYNEVARRRRERIEFDRQELVDRWRAITRKDYVRTDDESYLTYLARNFPLNVILEFMDIAEEKRVRSLKYVNGCVKNWLAENPEFEKQ